MGFNNNVKYRKDECEPLKISIIIVIFIFAKWNFKLNKRKKNFSTNDSKTLKYLFNLLSIGNAIMKTWHKLNFLIF